MWKNWVANNWFAIWMGPTIINFYHRYLYFWIIWLALAKIRKIRKNPWIVCVLDRCMRIASMSLIIYTQQRVDKFKVLQQRILLQSITILTMSSHLMRDAKERLAVSSTPNLFSRKIYKILLGFLCWVFIKKWLNFSKHYWLFQLYLLNFSNI